MKRGDEMKIKVYSFPCCQDSIRIKEFLKSKGIEFEEIIVNNEKMKNEVLKLSHQDKKSIIKIIKSRSISICTGFNEPALNQLL